MTMEPLLPPFPAPMSQKKKLKKKLVHQQDSTNKYVKENRYTDMLWGLNHPLYIYREEKKKKKKKKR